MELNFVCGVGSNFILFHINFQFYQNHLLRRLVFFLLNGVGVLVENDLPICVKFLFLGYFSLLVFMPIPHYFNYCSFVINFEARKYEFTNIVFFKIVWAVQSSLKFRMNFRMQKTLHHWDFDGDWIGSVYRLGNSDIFTILSIAIHEHLSFICVVFNFFSMMFLQFSTYKSFASLVKLIPNYFILFDAVVNIIVFLHFFLGCSLLVYFIFLSWTKNTNC